MFTNRIRQLSADQFVRNVSWVGGAELINRVFRLATTVTLARVFTPQDYGAVSAIYTIFEIVSIFTLGGGFCAKIIQSDDRDLDEICETTHTLSWLIAIGLFITQVIAAFPLANFYQNPGLTLPIVGLALVYLAFPWFLVQVALLDRRNQLQVRAWCNIAQAGLSNFLIVVLSILGCGVWSVVVPIVASSLSWIAITHYHEPWRPSRFSLHRWQEVLGFSGKALGIDFLVRFRRNIDYLIVGRFLGMEVLGMYFFAFNAGLGISQSVISALNAALYPRFCEVRNDKKRLRQRFFGSFKSIACTVVPLVLLQTMAAPFYVPIIFGQKWVSGIPILIVICCSAIPMALFEANSKILLALDEVTIDLKWNLFFSAIFTVLLLTVVSLGLSGIAVTVLVSQAIFAPIFTVWIVRHLLHHGDA